MHLGGCIAQSQSNLLAATWSADTALVLGVNVILEGYVPKLETLQVDSNFFYQ